LLHAAVPFDEAVPIEAGRADRDAVPDEATEPLEATEPVETGEAAGAPDQLVPIAAR
jgi:hypothetical protein